MDLAALVAPEHTSVLTTATEMERGGVGDLARFTGPAEAARESGMNATVTTVDELIAIWSA